MLSAKNKEKLIEKGVRILFEQEDVWQILKETGAQGHSIPNRKFGPLLELDISGNTVNETYSDCPHMMLCYEKDAYRLICWDWVPGPGPGDFDLVFENEESVVSFIESYYFGENDYFKKRLEYELKQDR